jgi:hypothetical protein
LAEKATLYANDNYPAPLLSDSERAQAREQVGASLEIVAVVAIIAGTITEDVATLGVGILNDPATISGGLALINHGWNGLQ